jgi:L-ascorbate metabolism protein UlaG (beta-lactamase superfamily)
MALFAVHVGGPTLVLDLAGLRLLVDPTFSPPGDYESAPGRWLTKFTGPAVPAAEVGRVDAVLLSHDQHVDNLDPGGRAVVTAAPIVLTTPGAAARLAGNTRGLEPWERAPLPRAGRSPVHVTAVPALHGPDGAEAITGPVTGFVLTADGEPTVYISGDNASLEHVEQIARRTRPIDVAVLFAGAARSPKLLGEAFLTLDSAGAARAAEVLGAPIVVPVHYEGWGHFTEGADDLRAAFAEAGLSDRLHLLTPGRRTELAHAPARVDGREGADVA